MKMKTFKVKVEYVGLTGKYTNEYEIEARTPKFASLKAYAKFGDREGRIIAVDGKAWDTWKADFKSE
jgi:hypothetical protein